jgi:hypothetical protein
MFQNLALANPCQSMKRYSKSIQALNIPSPSDMTRGFFSFHVTVPTRIKPICNDSFHPKHRAGQGCGPVEYFGVTSTISHGYSSRGNSLEPYSMLLHCPQLSISKGCCYIMNDPID